MALALADPGWQLPPPGAAGRVRRRAGEWIPRRPSSRPSGGREPKNIGGYFLFVSRFSDPEMNSLHR